MALIWPLEINWILIIQQLGSWLLLPMKFFTFLGQEEFFLLIMPAVYWCIDSGLGFRLGLMLMTSNAFNSLFKLAFHSPRPFWYAAEIQARASEASFGMPSGHAQTAAALWGMLAASFRRRWATIAVTLIVFLIGFSRLYLGMHFISDVIAGWLIGGLLLLAFIKLEKPIGNWIARRPFASQLGLIAITSLGMLLLAFLLLITLQNIQLPAVWTANSLADNAPAPDPLSLNGIFTVAGTFLGLAGGYAWLRERKQQLDVKGTPAQLLLRYLVGVTGVLALWYGLGLFFPRSADLLGFSLRFLRYSLLGAWVSAIAPLLFFRLGIAKYISTRP
jgi:membrane-associated phospholipid phosphatase